MTSQVMEIGAKAMIPKAKMRPSQKILSPILFLIEMNPKGSLKN
jgi:hypothetical protein